MFCLLQDALTLQRVCLEKKQDLCLDDGSEVPDVRAAVQELMTSLYIATYNHTVSLSVITPPRRLKKKKKNSLHSTAT